MVVFQPESSFCIILPSDRAGGANLRERRGVFGGSASPWRDAKRPP